MLALIISILISIGTINSADDYNNSSIETQSMYNDWIIDEDISGV